MEKSRRYSFEEAQDEALKLQNKILSGEALDYPEAEKHLEHGLLKPEQVEKVIEKYEKDIKEIVRIMYKEADEQTVDGHAPISGELGGLKYRNLKTYRQGKQQAVTIVEFTLPDASKFNLVCKYDGLDMYKKQQQDAALQKYLPKIYFESDGVAVIEKIDGLELDRFEQALGDKVFFDQLVNESVEIVHDMHHSGFYLYDVDFVSGHNVMYDLGKKHFRVFDIHAANYSDKKPEEKLFDFLNQIVSNELGKADDILRAKFMIAFVKEYLKAYPEEPLFCDGSVFEEPAPGMPDYEEAFERIKKRRGDRARYGAKILVEKKGKIVIDPEVLSSIKENDEEKLLAFLSKKPRDNRVTALDRNV